MLYHSNTVGFICVILSLLGFITHLADANANANENKNKKSKRRGYVSGYNICVIIDFSHELYL